MGGDAEVRRSMELECVHSGLGCTGRHRGLRLQDKDLAGLRDQGSIPEGRVT